MSESKRQSQTPTYDGLSYQHKHFVDAYIGVKDDGEGRFNATKSYELAGYVSNDGNATRLKGKERIQSAISERLAQLAMTDREAAAVIAEQAKGSLSPFLRFDDKTKLYEIDLTSDEAQANLHLIKKIKQKKRIRRDENGNPRAFLQHDIELHDPQAAAHKIRQAHGAYGAKGTKEDPMHFVGFDLGLGNDDEEDE